LYDTTLILCVIPYSCSSKSNYSQVTILRYSPVIQIKLYVGGLIGLYAYVKQN